MKEAKTTGELRGVRLRILNTVIIVVACILSLALILSIYRTTRSYNEMRTATEQYNFGQQHASELQAGSDYLTEQVRYFVVTGDVEHLHLYFEEAEITRRRERAVESFREDLAGSSLADALEQANQISNELMEREYYAMRLTIEARGYALASFPAVLQQVELTPEDAALSAEEKGNLARSMVFDSAYQDDKDQISRNVNLCLEELVNGARKLQTESTDRLLLLLRNQEILAGIQLLLVFLAVLLTSRLVIRPLRESVLHIQNQELLPLKGSYEFRFLAKTYNEIYEHDRRKREQLSYDASHDALTGLYNRASFDAKRRGSQGRQHALLLIDVDEFKSVNDNYGHDTGDRILQKVARGLEGCFRAEDAVCRMGGDEFAVIMVHAGSELRDLIEQKILGLIETLSHPTDGLPPVTLSVGVAFAVHETTADELYKQADTALYRVKNAGRKGCAFYEDITAKENEPC